MNITAELSLYPLTDQYIPTIKAYIDTLNTFDALEVRTHSLSTEIFGDYDTVMDAVKLATKTVFEQSTSTVLIAKYLNKDRR